jgi:serine/threonine protein kinase
MAPELFWDRTGDVASDVYSIGLLLFAGISGGRLPFFPEGTEEPSRRCAPRRCAAG